MNKHYEDDPSTTVDESKLFNNGGKSNSKVESAVLLTVLGFLLLAAFPFMFLVVLLSAAGIYGVFRFKHVRPSVLALFTGIISPVILSLFFASFDINKIPRLINFVLAKDNASISLRFMRFWVGTAGITWLGVLVGAVIGIISAYSTQFRLHSNDYLVNVQGERFYGWRYARTPWQLFKRKNLIKKIKENNYPVKNGFVAGIEEEPICNVPLDPADIKYDKPISLYDSEAVRMTLITGASGSGKTITMQNNIRHDMTEGNTIFIIDCKSDPVFASKIASWSNELGLNFYHFAPNMASEYRITQNPQGVAYYDPLAHGRVAEHTDMLIGVREWDAASAVYKSNAQSVLSTVFSVMEKMNYKDPALSGLELDRGNLWTFRELIKNNDNFNLAVSTIPDNSEIRIMGDELVTLLSPTNRTREAQNMAGAFGEYRGLLRQLSTSDGKFMIKPKNSDSKSIDVFKLASEPKNVVLFSITATKPTDMGAMIGSMICTDLTNMTATRAINGQTNFVHIYIDEFQSLPPTCVKSMLEKARSARIGVTLAFQSLEQVTASAGSDALINSLLDTGSNFIFHAGANENTALTMSKIIGKHSTVGYTIQRRNQQGWLQNNYFNNRNANTMKNEVDKYIIEPSAFQHLAAPTRENGFKSEAIIIKKASSDAIDKGINGAIAHKVWMIPPTEILEDDYFDPNTEIIPLHEEKLNVPAKSAQSDSINSIGAGQNYVDDSMLFNDNNVESNALPLDSTINNDSVNVNDNINPDFYNQPQQYDYPTFMQQDDDLFGNNTNNTELNNYGSSSVNYDSQLFGESEQLNNNIENEVKRKVTTIPVNNNSQKTSRSTQKRSAAVSSERNNTSSKSRAVSRSEVNDNSASSTNVDNNSRGGGLRNARRITVHNNTGNNAAQADGNEQVQQHHGLPSRGGLRNAIRRK